MASRESFPVELPAFVHVPGSNPYVFYLELRGEALEAVGVLERVSGIFAKHGVPILQVNVAASGEAGRLIVFADLKDEKLADKLVGELEKVPYALRAYYSKPTVSGFAYCDRCFPLTVRGSGRSSSRGRFTRASSGRVGGGLGQGSPSCYTCSVSSPAASPTRGTWRWPAATREPR
jgi:hypothetical protein